MGDAINKLVALTTEHVSAYTRKDGTHVAAHTREFNPGDKVFKGRAGSKVWEISKAIPTSSLDAMSQDAYKGHSHVYTIKNPDNPKGSNSTYITPDKLRKAQAGEHASPALKTPQKSAVAALKSKTAAPPEGAKPTKSVNYFKGRHPAPAHDVPVDDRQLQLWSDGKYRWRYFVNGKWVNEHEM